MNYFAELNSLFIKIKVNDAKERIVSFDKTISKIIELIVARNKEGNKIMLIGNGGSASIASHLATDFLKNAQTRAMAFNDSSLITCLSNDLGYEYVFEKPLGMLSQENDILFAISSSGKSKNILNATATAKKKGCFIITLSGFDRNNPLRKLGEINFYVPSHSYGYVEIIHLVICHLIVDNLIEVKHKGGCVGHKNK